ARMKADLSIPAAEELPAPTLDRVHEYLAADFVVVGTYAVIGSGAAQQIRLDLRIQDTSRGQTTASVAESGSVADLSGLVSRAGNRLRTDLGLRGLSDVESKAVRAASVSAVEAAQLYSKGLERMRLFEVIQAKDLFEKAARLEPESALIHAAIADAWLALGHDRKAREAAERAIARAGGLSREDRLGIEGRAAEASKSWSEANRVYGALASFFPDDVRYSLKLAEVQTSGGKPRDALRTIESLRRPPLSAGLDARLDVYEATAAGALGDGTRSLAAAQSGFRKATALGARLLCARARNREAAALISLGRLDDAAAAARSARDLSEAAGDAYGVVESLNQIGLAFWQKADFDAAEKAFLEIRDRATSIGNQRALSTSINNLAVMSLGHGDAQAAMKLHRQALEIFRDIGDKDGTARALVNLARLEWAETDLASAGRRIEEALALYREIGTNVGIGLALTNLGDLQLRSGEAVAGRHSLEEAVRLLRASDDKRRLSIALDELGNARQLAGDVAAARDCYEEALRIQEGMKTDLDLYSRALLSEALFSEGRFEEAERAALAVAAAYQTRSSDTDRADAVALSALSLLRRDRVDEARRRFSTVARVPYPIPVLAWSVSRSETEALLFAYGGKVKEASARLNAVAVESRRRGNRLDEWTALLALAEIEILSGERARARERLAPLEQELRVRG
ncbi:MAG TPA: tetratricopeptide repeat protein, partial [Thermoanaerobaculia bacterium]|nr:tetratricopeptide repeat protein [Thermoanaerobaculia bacterium]